MESWAHNWINNHQLKSFKENYEKAFLNFKTQENLKDIWRKWNTKTKKITFYSASNKYFSRTDMIWVSKQIVITTRKIEILLKMKQ